MQVQNSYYFFKSVLTPDQCKKIIDYGVSEMTNIKKMVVQQRQQHLGIITNKLLKKKRVKK